MGSYQTNVSEWIILIMMDVQTSNCIPPTEGEGDIIFGVDPVGISMTLVCRYLVNQWADLSGYIQRCFAGLVVRILFMFL